MNMANAMKAVRSEEMRLKKKSKVFEMPKSTLKNKVKNKETDVKETDQYPTCSETSVALQSRRRTCQLLSDDERNVLS
jgi:hypothetical protein